MGGVRESKKKVSGEVVWVFFSLPAALPVNHSFILEVSHRMKYQPVSMVTR